jgi:hypothetical protein
MDKQTRYLGFSGVFLVVFFCYIIQYEYGLGSMFLIGPYKGYGYSILGGSLSNIYWFFLSVIDKSTDVVFLIFSFISLVHLYLSYRLLSHIWQVKVVKWHWWGIWAVNCYIWFFMGGILPLMMRL